MTDPSIANAATPRSDDAEVATLVAENADLRDRYLRALADAENARRRGELQVEDAKSFAITKFARQLLPVADNLQRAIVATKARSEYGDAAFLEGVKATDRLLTAASVRFGVRKIAVEGAGFDPHLHEAVMELDDKDRPSGTVLQVLEDGYTIHDRSLRPARVVVVKRRGAGSALGA